MTVIRPDDKPKNGPEIGSEAWVKTQIAKKLVPQERDRPVAPDPPRFHA